MYYLDRPYPYHPGPARQMKPVAKNPPYPIPYADIPDHNLNPSMRIYKERYILAMEKALAERAMKEERELQAQAQREEQARLQERVRLQREEEHRRAQEQRQEQARLQREEEHRRAREEQQRQEQERLRHEEDHRRAQEEQRRQEREQHCRADVAQRRQERNQEGQDQAYTARPHSQREQARQPLRGRGGGSARQGRGGWQPAEGDWVCAACGNVNFAWRNMCNRCAQPNASGGRRDGDSPVNNNGYRDHSQQLPSGEARYSHARAPNPTPSRVLNPAPAPSRVRDPAPAPSRVCAPAPAPSRVRNSDPSSDANLRNQSVQQNGRAVHTQQPKAKEVQRQQEPEHDEYEGKQDDSTPGAVVLKEEQWKRQVPLPLQSAALPPLPQPRPAPPGPVHPSSVPVPDSWPEEPERAAPGERECELCLERAKITLIEPCRHVVTCVRCARLFGSQQNPSCPKCRIPITRIVRIFY